jgi:hypothetical protein
MALFALKGVFTAPTVDGTDTVLTGLVSPKVVILWTTRQTTTGAVDKNGELYLGVFTYDGAAVQQWYAGFGSDDAGAASNTARLLNTTACLKGETDATPTVDFEARGVSMDATSITIDWFNAPTSAILVHYLVLGGDDLTKARAGTGTVSTANTDNFTINSGWGQPDLLLFATTSATVLGDASAGRLNISVACDYQTRRLSGWWETDNAATMTCSAVQKAKAVATLASISSMEGESELSLRPAWPADGFQLDHSANTYSVAHVFCYLALKGTFLSNIGVYTVPVTGSSPSLTQDVDVGFPPAAAILFGGVLVANTAVDTASADMNSFFFGATDGVTEGMGGHYQNQGNITAVTGTVHDETKAIGHYIADAAGGAPILKTKADSSFSGNSLRLIWDNFAGIAREFCWLALGSAPVPRPLPNYSPFPKVFMRPVA